MCTLWKAWFKRNASWEEAEQRNPLHSLSWRGSSPNIRMRRTRWGSSFGKLCFCMWSNDSRASVCEPTIGNLFILTQSSIPDECLCLIVVLFWGRLTAVHSDSFIFFRVCAQRDRTSCWRQWLSSLILQTAGSGKKFFHPRLESLLTSHSPSL